MSKDARAQKLAFQHWIEAVITIYFLLSKAFAIYLIINVNVITWNCRLIRGIDMGIACIITMKSGAKPMLVSHFSTGKQNFAPK